MVVRPYFQGEGQNHVLPSLRTPMKVDQRISWKQNVLEKISCDLATLAITPQESLPPGSSEMRPFWACLNRLRTAMGLCKANLVKWGYKNSCLCGEEQTMAHLNSCPLLPTQCRKADLATLSSDARLYVEHWCGCGAWRDSRRVLFYAAWLEFTSTSSTFLLRSTVHTATWILRLCAVVYYNVFQRWLGAVV